MPHHSQRVITWFSLVLLCACSGPSTNNGATVPVQERRAVADAAPEAEVIDASTDASTDVALAVEAPTENDHIAMQILRGYDPRTHRAEVHTSTAPGAQETTQHVYSVHGDQALVENMDTPGSVVIELRPGTDWAQNLSFATVVVGHILGMCGEEQGWLALIDRSGTTPRVLAFRPLVGGGCAQESGHQFVTAGGQRVLFASGGTSGEEGPSITTTYFWVFDGAQFLDAGHLVSGQSPGAQGGRRAFSSTFSGSPQGLVQRQEFLLDERVVRRTQRTLPWIPSGTSGTFVPTQRRNPR